jgi:hypothetical protein
MSNHFRSQSLAFQVYAKFHQISEQQTRKNGRINSIQEGQGRRRVVAEANGRETWSSSKWQEGHVREECRQRKRYAQGKETSQRRDLIPFVHLQSAETGLFILLSCVFMFCNSGTSGSGNVQVGDVGDEFNRAGFVRTLCRRSWSSGEVFEDTNIAQPRHSSVDTSRSAGRIGQTRC